MVACASCGGAGRYWVDGYTGERTGAPGDVAPSPEVVILRRRVGCAWCQEGDPGRWDPVRGTWVPSGRRFEGLPRGSGARAGGRCGPCDGSGWLWLPIELFETPGGASGARDRVAWRIAGSYAELVRALENVRLSRSREWRRLMRDASAGVWPLVDELAIRGLELVVRQMPARIDVSGDVMVAWRARRERAQRLAGPRRDARIRELVAAGESPAAVARRAGLSERRVRQIAYGS